MKQGDSAQCVSIPHSQGPVRPERPALAPQRRRRGARAAQQSRTARWHRTVPVKGGWEGLGKGIGEGGRMGKGAEAKRLLRRTPSQMVSRDMKCELTWPSR